MVSLGKNPRVAIRDGAKIKRKIRLPVRNRCSDLKRKALRKPGALRAQAPYLAACSIGADQKTGLIGLPGGDQLDAISAARNLSQAADPSETSARRDRFSQAVFVELRSDRHHADGLAALQ